MTLLGADAARRGPGKADEASRGQGQALPEFALVVPIFFLVLFGIMQLGFLFAGQNGMSNAAREAARYASTLPTPDTTVAGDCATSGTNAKAVYDRLQAVNLVQYIPGFLPANLVAASPLSSCGATALARTSSGVGYCASANADGTYDLRVRVVVTYRHPLFIPLVGRIFSATNTWQLQAVEEMRVEGPSRSTTGGFTGC
jgi:Flp pilus assembly protein TadG